MQNIKFIADRDQTPWIIHLGESRNLLRLAVSISIDKTDDLSFPWTLAERPQHIYPDKNLSSRSSTDTGWARREIRTGKSNGRQLIGNLRRKTKTNESSASERDLEEME
jgi:hypothetical protein